MNCNHVFPYLSVLQPSHCPCCGACLHPVKMAPYPPAQPWPSYPWNPYRPYSTTVYTSNTTGTGTPMNAVAA